MILASPQTREVYPSSDLSGQPPRPYKGLPLGTILDMIDKAQADMRSAGRSGDAAGYRKSEAEWNALHDAWDAIDAAEQRGRKR